MPLRQMYEKTGAPFAEGSTRKHFAAEKEALRLSGGKDWAGEWRLPADEVEDMRRELQAKMDRESAEVINNFECLTSDAGVYQPMRTVMMLSTKNAASWF